MPKPPDGPAEGDPAPLTYDPEIGPGYFVQTRSDFLRWGGYTPLLKVLYQVLCSYAAAGETAWPGQQRLADHCGVSVRTIQSAIDDLAATGLIVVTRRGLGRTNLYHIHKLPTVLGGAKVANPDTQYLRIKKRKDRVSVSATVADKEYTAELEADQGESAAPGALPVSGWLYMIATDTAAELHLPGDVPARVLAAWHRSGLDEAAMADRLYQARNQARKVRGDKAAAYWAKIEQG